MKRSCWFYDQSGSVALIGALCLSVVIGIAAVVIDLGHAYVVREELQNAADAGALAGARALVPYVTTSSPPQPNWSQAETKATQTVKLNNGDGQLLTDCTTQSGYWNTHTNILQSSAISPGTYDVPAVQVTAVKTTGQNGGPLQMFFGQTLGLNISNITVKAMAFISGLSGIPANGGGFPLAVPQSLVDSYWDQSPPVSFKIGSAYHSPDGGQWTSFLADANDVPTIRGLMANGNPAPLNIGENIYIQPGTKTTLYADASAYIGKTFVLTVVNTDFSTHSYTPILGFVSFYIEDAKGGSGKYIQGHFVKDRAVTQGTPGGPYNGTFLPPKQVY